jgi:hypothetical protein
MKKFITALIGATFLFLGGVAYADIPQIGDPGRAWAIPDNAQPGQQIEQFLDNNLGDQPSWLLNNDTPHAATGSNQDFESDPTCQSATDEKCLGHSMSYQANLPTCTSDAQTDCIMKFGTIDESGTTTQATFSRYFPLKAQNQFTGDPTINLPSGYPGSLFTLPQAMHAGGDKYYVSVLLRGDNSYGANQFNRSDFSINVYPVALENYNYYRYSGSSVQDSGYSLNGRGRQDGSTYWGQAGLGWSGATNCVADSVHESLCAQRYAFPANCKFYIKVKLNSSPGGWLHGRITNPNISISTSGSNTIIEISADPVAVPAVYKMYNYVDMPPALQSNYDLKTGAYNKDPWFLQNPTAVQGGRLAPNDDPRKRNVIISCQAYTGSCMDQLKLWLPYVGDQATALMSHWSVRTLASYEMNGASPCFTDPNNVTGIVTTNSTQYSDGPPAFNSDDGTLKYQVASPHYTTTKDVFKGTYDLVMRSDVARCLYGFSKAPINATISVTSADGTPELATTVVGEKDGWLYLSAKNFEFSSPTVQAKLTQEAPAPTPAPAKGVQSMGSTTNKVLTITCTKGKISKMISGPACPSGYKRK